MMGFLFAGLENWDELRGVERLCKPCNNAGRLESGPFVSVGEEIMDEFSPRARDGVRSGLGWNGCLASAVL